MRGYPIIQLKELLPNTITDKIPRRFLLLIVGQSSVEKILPGSSMRTGEMIRWYNCTVIIGHNIMLVGADQE